MRRRQFILLATAALTAPGRVVAREFVDLLVEELSAQGYFEFDISRTLLGRTRIVAISETLRREIIINAKTGEILRDYWEVIGEEGESMSGLFDPDDDKTQSGASTNSNAPAEGDDDDGDVGAD